MAHTYCSALFHCVFSTKERRKTIAPELQERLWAYMGGIARENAMKAIAVGGMDDHAHILLSLPSSLSISEAMRKIKGGSSRWLHESCGLTGFEWQQGYGAFSIGGWNTMRGMCGVESRRPYGTAGDVGWTGSPGFTPGLFSLAPSGSRVRGGLRFLQSHPA
jgi:REP element-mobilizing transposase RayT